MLVYGNDVADDDDGNDAAASCSNAAQLGAVPPIPSPPAALMM